MNVEIKGLERDKTDGDTTIITLKFKLPKICFMPVMSNGYEDRTLKDYEEMTYRRRVKAKKELTELRLGHPAKLFLNELNRGIK